MCHDFTERLSVFRARPLVILRPEPPVHAPATVAGAVLAEQVFQSGPQIRREWADGELHAVFASVPPNYPAHPPGGRNERATPDSLPARRVGCSGWFVSWLDEVLEVPIDRDAIFLGDPRNMPTGG